LHRERPLVTPAGETNNQMKMKLPITAAVCIAALALGAPSTASAKEKKTTAATPEASASPMAKVKAIPYHGKVSSVDVSAKTFVVGKRTFNVTDQTQITKEGAAATMSDLMAGEKVSGSYWKKAEGTLEAKTVKVGAKTEAQSKSTTATKKKEDASTEAKPSP
jgi:Domain of unknown function (DUF5666)